MSSPLLTSTLLPVPHGFATRQGGVSESPFDSLNLGFSVGDEEVRVKENHARLARDAGLALATLSTVTQVHGDGVLEAQTPPEQPLAPLGEADALYTEKKGAWVGIRTADCVPILLVDPKEKRVAAVHSGWRGTAAEVVRRQVEVLVSRGTDAKELLAVVGPAIGPCCYEVSPQLADLFRRQFGEAAVVGRPQGARLNLSAAVALTLRKAGLPADRIEQLHRCTACEPELFFSHRRDAGKTGRHLSFVACVF